MTQLATRSEGDPSGGNAAAAARRLSGLSGADKAMLLLVSLDESVATRVLSFLTPEEVLQLRKASERLSEVDPAMVTAVHREFAEQVHSGVPASLKGSGAYLRRLAGQALGEGKVAELWEDREDAVGPVAQLSRLSVPTILALVGNEKPQTLAVLLSQFEAGRAAEVLHEMPTEVQAEIVLRMARLRSVPESVIEQMEAQFASELASLGECKRRDIEGIATAASVVKRLESDTSEALLEELSTLDSTVAEDLRRNLFTFEDLLRVDARGMQQLLKEVATEQLVTALKTASEDLREKIFGNVSSRAANMLRDELEMLGPVRVSDVEAAQEAVCQVAVTLEQEGRIQIAREGGSDYV